MWQVHFSGDLPLGESGDESPDRLRRDALRPPAKPRSCICDLGCNLQFCRIGRQVNSSKFEGGEETIIPIGMRTTYGTQQMSEEPTSQRTPAPPYRDLGTLLVEQKKCHPHAAMSASYSELTRDPASGRFVGESRRWQHDAGEGSAQWAATRAPSRTKAFAVASPIPLLPPIINAVLSSTRTAAISMARRRLSSLHRTGRRPLSFFVRAPPGDRPHVIVCG
jgi:hypothetical protein